MNLSTLILSNAMHQYHQRLITLDNQVEYLHTKSLQGLGQWLSKHWYSCQDKHICHQAWLDDMGIDEDYLREQWHEQVRQQTKPPPRMIVLVLVLLGAHILCRPITEQGKPSHSSHFCLAKISGCL